MLSTPITMKKLSLYMVDADAQKAAMALAHMAVIHPLDGQEELQILADYPAATYYEVYHDLNARFGKIISLTDQTFTPVVESLDIVTLLQLQDMDEQLEELWSRLSSLEEQLRRQNEKLNVVRQLSSSLQKFASLDLDLSRLRRGGKFLRIDVGTVPSGNFSQLRQALSLTHFMIKSFYAAGGNQHVVVFGASQHHEDVQALLESADFRGLGIPEEFSGSPSELKTDMEQQQRQIVETIGGLRQKLSGLLSENQSRLKSVHDLLLRAEPYASLANVLKGRGGLVSLQGWVPEHCEKEIRCRLEQDLECPFYVEFSEPGIEEFDVVPSLLKTSWLLKPFQNLVRNFGMPGYREVDPSGLFALSYILMFGMMFGDVGHGGVILLGSLMLYRRYPAFGIVGVLGGISSILFGFIYGSIFGYEDIIPALWMSPMHDPVKLLLIAVVWGAGFLLIANLLAIRNYLATAQFQQAFYSGKGMAGLFFYLAALFAGYQWAVYQQFGWLEGLSLIAPMSVILQFQWRHSSAGLVERVLVVFIEGLEHIISSVSGTLSFLRVAAFSLNHIALAAAVFSIAGMMGIFGHWMAIVLGNIFIIVLEGAIVAIQCLRLEYYEGFSRFFGGKGKAFKPLQIEI